MLTKLGRDEVIMALHVYRLFGQIYPEVDPGQRKKIGQWGTHSPKDIFFRSECNSNKLNWNIPIVCWLISQIWQSCFLINHLLRNLAFNRSAHCTQVSDQCPFGLVALVTLSFMCKKKCLNCVISCTCLTFCPTLCVLFHIFTIPEGFFLAQIRSSSSNVLHKSVINLYITKCILLFSGSSTNLI